MNVIISVSDLQHHKCEANSKQSINQNKTQDMETENMESCISARRDEDIRREEEDEEDDDKQHPCSC